jgi:hypothetical protein
LQILIFLFFINPKFIASESRNQLETVIENYNNFKDLNLLDQMHAGTFGIICNLSSKISKII